MSRIVPLPLVSADFYLLHDFREDPDLVLGGRQHDPDPTASAALAAEIAKRLTAIDPMSRPQFHGGLAIELTPDIAPRVSCFRSERPKSIPCYGTVVDFSRIAPYGRYWVVSAAWKEAIESLETGVHRFFPHELRFGGSVVSDYFIFLDAPWVERGPSDFSAEWVVDQFSRLIGYRLKSGHSEEPVTIDRELATGRNHLRSGYHQFVSRALAEKLHPLLPRGVVLIPIGFTGETPQPSFHAPKSEFPESTSEPLEPALRQALELLADQYRHRDSGYSHAEDAARALIKRRARIASLPQLFAMMAVTISFLGGLHQNLGFTACLEACRLRPERDVLPYAQAWARDPDPVKRAAAAYILWRHSPYVGDEVEHGPDTRATLIGLLEDPDPRVVAKAIGVLAWAGLPVYEEALHDRRALFESHPDEDVRAIFKAKFTDQT